MPRGDKSKYTEKQERQAEHIEDSYRKQGVAEGEAEGRAWATVNAMDHRDKLLDDFRTVCESRNVSMMKLEAGRRQY